MFLPWDSSCNAPPDQSKSQTVLLHQRRISVPFKTVGYEGEDYQKAVKTWPRVCSLNLKWVLAREGWGEAARSGRVGEGDFSEPGSAKTRRLKGQEPGPCKWPPCADWKVCTCGPSSAGRLSNLSRTTQLVLGYVIVLWTELCAPRPAIHISKP